MTTSQPIKRHGGKRYLAEKIIGLMPPRCENPNAPKASDPGWCHYVEPFFGGGAVLLAQDPNGIGEVVNDLDGDLSNFWQVLRIWTQFVQFKQMCEATPCSETVFEEALARLEESRYGVFTPGYSDDCIERAWAFFVVNRQSRQALGRDFATLARNRTRRGMNELPSAWLSAVDGLPEVHQRLKRVVILNEDAVRVIQQQDGPRTFFYCDPPYVHDTRSTTGEYKHEMSLGDHNILLNTLAEIQGKFILSGYHHPLYDQAAHRNKWRFHEIPIDNKASGKKQKETKIEVLWMNYTTD
jgi:DNA adenine methylase